MENHLGTSSTRPGSSTTNRSTTTHTPVHDTSPSSSTSTSCVVSGRSTRQASSELNVSTPPPFRSDVNPASTASTATPMTVPTIQQSTTPHATTYTPASVSASTSASILSPLPLNPSSHHSHSSANLASNNSSSVSAAPGPTKTKFPFSVIYQAPFMDTVAILVLFMQFPLFAVIIIHLLFIASFFSNPNNHNNNLISPLGFLRNPILSLLQHDSNTQNQYTGSTAHSNLGDCLSSPASLNGLNSTGLQNGNNQHNNAHNGTATGSIGHNISFKKYNYIVQRALHIFGFGNSSVLSILKIIAADIVAAMCTIYLMPHSKNLISVFSCAIIASSLGGGPSPFTNAIYSTTTVEIASIVWSQISRALFSSTVIDHLHSPDHNNVYGDYLTIGSSSVYPTTPYAGGSYNTLTSAWALLPRFFRFAKRLNWINEMPVILCQIVAIHVIGLGLLPFLKKIFSDNTNKPTERHFKSSNGPNPSSLTANFQSGPSSNYNSYNSGYANSNNNSNTSSSSYESPNDHHVTTITVHDDIASGNRNFEIDSHTKPYKDFEFFYVSSSTKKNKRLTQVRTNQPLWSTLASSIVLAARQESSTGLNADEELAITSGIGVCLVRFIFENLIVLELNNYDTNGSYEVSVRVNGIQWPQVSICEDDTQNSNVSSFSSVPLTKADESAESSPISSTDYTTINKTKNPVLIILYGLTPMTQYDFEVLCAKDSSPDEFLTLIKSSITTSARSSPSLSSSLTSSSSNAYNSNSNNPLPLRDIQPPTRPVSPVTTLLNTLTSAQMTLSDEKQKFKRVKKDHTKRLTALRGEIDSLKSKMGGNDKGDERNRRKVLGLRKEVEQNKETIDILNKEYENLINLETELASEHLKRKKEWEAEISELKKKEARFSEQRGKSAEEVNAIESEVFALASKRDKLLAKKERLRTDLDRISTECQQNWDLEIQKQIVNREKRLEKRKKVEDELSSAMEQLKKGAENARLNASNVWVSIQMHQGGSFPHISNPNHNFSASTAPVKDSSMSSTLKSPFLGH